MNRFAEDDERAVDATVAAAQLPDDVLIVLPVRDVVLFPGLVTPVTVGRRFSVLGAVAAMGSGRQVGVLLQRDGSIERPAPAELERVGTAATIARYVTTPDGVHHVVCQGQQRFRAIEFVEGYPFYAARVERIVDPAVPTPGTEARAVQIRELAGDILALVPDAPPDLASVFERVQAPGALADLVAALMDLPPPEQQEILATTELEPRLEKVIALFVRRVEVLRLSAELEHRTRGRLDDQQRELLLREQLKTIREELGEGDDAGGVAELEEAIGKAGLPPEVLATARKELRRLARMSEAAAEYSMLRTYLEWLAELPWSARSEDCIDIAAARRVLDEDHCGLDQVKRRILEYLAVRKLRPAGRSPILCFVGPPGVGKTSLGQSIARAIGRKFVRVSLGGVHGEAEIRGHRRTYVGALPGNIIQALHKAGSRNCVLMLDELDKLGSGVQGDPSAALLEVLDPEQNATFRDNYLGAPFDLSQVMFLATANVLDTIPGPLRDRVEVIHLPGYTEQEKAEIARRFIVPRQRDASGLSAEQCEITAEAVQEIQHGYTREAGVRNLEREIGHVFRHAAMRIAEGTAGRVRVDRGDLEAVLGAPSVECETALRNPMPGVATGLAWTPTGGDILFVEATMTPGSGKLILTGQLGEVMKESAQAALTLVKAEGHGVGAQPEGFDHRDVHIHVPAGAIPKDGPSAGLAIFVALESLVRDRSVRTDRAMTGEISLRGSVLPVGGIREKVLAALRAGITTVLLPARNRRMLDEIPEEVRRRVHFIWLDSVDEALEAAFVTEEGS